MPVSCAAERKRDIKCFQILLVVWLVAEGIYGAVFIILLRRYDMTYLWTEIKKLIITSANDVPGNIA